MFKVDHFNYDAFKYSEAHASLLNTLCSPLLQTGVSTFAYFRFFSNGKYLYLCNNIKWVEYCLREIQHNNTTLGCQIAHAHKDNYFCYLWPTERQDSLLSALYSFDIWNGLSIFKELPDKSVELWGFGAKKENDNISSFYMAEIEELKKFTQYFNAKANTVITPCENNLAIYKNYAYNLNEKKIDIENPLEIEKFLNETRLLKYPILTPNEEVYLSRQEFKCLNYLSLGFSEEEISSLVGVSKGSISGYFKNIRFKLKSNKKTILVEIFKKSKREWL